MNMRNVKSHVNSESQVLYTRWCLAAFVLLCVIVYVVCLLHKYIARAVVADATDTYSPKEFVDQVVTKPILVKLGHPVSSQEFVRRIIEAFDIRKDADCYAQVSFPAGVELKQIEQALLQRGWTMLLMDPENPGTVTSSRLTGWSDCRNDSGGGYVYKIWKEAWKSSSGEIMVIYLEYFPKLKNSQMRAYQPWSSHDFDSTDKCDDRICFGTVYTFGP